MTCIAPSNSLLLLMFMCGAFSLAQPDVCNSMVEREECLSKFRARYLDNDYFWFGTSYNTLCPGGPLCLNPRPDLQSVMAKVLSNNDVTALERAVSNMKVLNVTFQQPARNYTGCDHTFNLEARDRVQVPPFGPTLVPLATLSERPSITWQPRAAETLYTVIMWDVGSVVLHSVFVNCRGGSIDGCEVVKPWLGPGVAYLVNSPYVFIAQEQSGRVPLDFVQTAVDETTLEGGDLTVIGGFELVVFLRKMSGYISADEIQFSVIMEVYPDPYGATIVNKFHLIDQCPLFFSTLPLFELAVAGMQIPDLKWSPPAYSFSQVSGTRPHLTSLTVNIHVKYQSEEFNFTSCCKSVHIEKGTYIVDPFDKTPWRPVVARDPPKVELTPVRYLDEDLKPISGKVYTLLMTDATEAVVAGVTDPALFTHWLVANIQDADMETGVEVVPYFGPNPPILGQVRTYMFLLFEQRRVADATELSPLCPGGFIRCKLKVSDLIETWNLGDIAGVRWFLAQRDEFALKRLTTVFGIPESEACKDVPGFSVPCQK